MRRLAPINPHTRAMRAFLADGEWHDLEELRAVAWNAVPPLTALAKHDMMVKHNGHSPNRIREDKIRMGTNRAVQDSIHRWERDGNIEIRNGKVRLL